jgi:hypothetical protein
MSSARRLAGPAGGDPAPQGSETCAILKAGEPCHGSDSPIAAVPPSHCRNARKLTPAEALGFNEYTARGLTDGSANLLVVALAARELAKGGTTVAGTPQQDGSIRVFPVSGRW